MSDVKSKNLYELLGNDHDQDSDREPDPPAKAIDKPAARQGKRDAPKAAPVVDTAAGTVQRGNRRGGGFTGSEAAFRERATGRTYNRDLPTGEGETGVRTGRDSGPGTRRAGRGPRGPRRGGDRHSRTGIVDTPKQTDQAWGQQTGDGEWADEKAGEAIATEEVKEGGFDAIPEAPVDGEGNTIENEEEKDTSKSYADYLAEQAAKKMESLGMKEARQANEGSKDNKQWKNAKEITRAEEEAYYAGEEKARRLRERTAKKEYVSLNDAWQEAPRDVRGGRGGPRGAGRGGRGGRGGDFPARSRGRGGPGRGRGGADGPGASAVAVNDESAFPSLGGK